MKDRLRQLRKELLKLNQTAFGKKIGLGQQSVANIETGVNSLTERNFEAICREFNVNPEWLRNGTGEPFLKPKVETFLDKIVAEKNLSEDDRALIESVLELPPQAREAVVAWAEKLVAKTRTKKADQAKEDERRNLEEIIADAQRRLAELDAPTKPDSELTREERHAMLDAELDAAEKRKMFSASTGLNGSSSKRRNGSP